MTDTAVSPQSAAQEHVDTWLSSFEQALADANGEAAGALFLADSYWRDLVAFTWNLKTVEGPEGVADLVDATAARAGASGFRTTEPASEAGGVIEAWIAFETEVGRGSGLVRLRDGKAWTLLTVLDELKGHEENKGPDRPLRCRARRRPRTA